MLWWQRALRWGCPGEHAADVLLVQAIMIGVARSLWNTLLSKRRYWSDKELTQGILRPHVLCHLKKTLIRSLVAERAGGALATLPNIEVSFMVSTVYFHLPSTYTLKIQSTGPPMQLECLVARPCLHPRGSASLRPHCPALAV